MLLREMSAREQTRADSNSLILKYTWVTESADENGQKLSRRNPTRVAESAWEFESLNEGGILNPRQF